MIYICADDYGLNDISSMHIQQCIDEGALNKVSVFPNFEKVDLHKLLNNKNIRISLHLNLVEGKCMADADEINLIADKNGDLKHTFGGLLKLNLFHGKKFGEQIAEVADYAVLIGEKRTKPIYEGLIDKGFDKEKIIVFNDVRDAYPFIGSLTGKKEVYALFENDLPDTYNE